MQIHHHSSWFCWSNKDFDQQIQWIRDILIVFIRIQDQELCSSWWWNLCQFRILKFVAWTQPLRWFNSGSNVGPTILHLFRCFFWRSGLLECWLRSYDGTIGFKLAVLIGLGRRYTHPGRWIRLPFRDHWPYRLRSNNVSCSSTNDWQFSIYPRRRIPAFILHGNKASISATGRQKNV
jgi:hypothetical protein